MNKASYKSGLLFTQAHQAVRARVHTILNKYELTPSYWAILGTAVEASDGIRLSNVAKQMNVKAPLVTMLTNDLIERDLINRLPHHSDGRAKLLVPTAKGKQLAKKIEIELSDEIKALMNGITDAEAAVFQKTLETILKNASVDQKF